jgi:hypothetical protein
VIFLRLFLGPCSLNLTIHPIAPTAPLQAPQAIKAPLQIQTATSARRPSLQPSLSPSPSSTGTSATAPVTPRTTSPGLYAGSLKPEAEAAGSGSGRGRKVAVPAVRGVRFADDEDATDGDDLPLAVLVAVQKKRAEREARARHQHLMREQARRSEHEQTRRHEVEASREAGSERGRDSKRSYAEEITRTRMLRESARAGVSRPASFARDAESKRESLSPARGHSRNGSGGSSAVNSHRRRNTVGEAILGAPASPGPAPPLPGTPMSASSSNFPASPGFSMAGLPSSAPTASSFPAGFGSPSPSGGFSHLPHSNSFPRPHSQSGSVSGLPSPNLPFAARSLSSSPLRASFALGPDEFGVASGMAGNAMMTNNAMMANNAAMIANNAAMLAAHSAMISHMGMPSPPFAGSASASGSAGRGRTSAYGTGPRSQSQGWNGAGRPGPSPMQMTGSSSGDRRSTAGDRRSTASDRKPTTGDRRSTAGDHANAPARSSAQAQTQPRRGGHAHSRSEHSNMPGRRVSKLSTISDAPPMPALSVPMGIYGSRARPRPGAEVIT